MLFFLLLFLLLDFKMNKIAIVGSNGFLGTNLYNFLDNHKNVIRISRKNADIILNSYTINNLTKIIKKYHLTHIINCVGFTDINNANKKFAECFQANVFFVKLLVNAIKKSRTNTRLIHISTDHLYSKKGMSLENNINISNLYAQSKFLGEQEALKSNPIILRTNFFWDSVKLNKQSLSDWITNSLEQNNVISCFNDIKFNPIHFSTLSNILEKFIHSQNLEGIYNTGSTDGLSKYNFAKKIAGHKNLNLNLIKKIDSDEYFEIKRPKDMRMNVSKIQRTLKIKMPCIKEEIYKLN